MIYVFGDCELRRGGVLVMLEPKACKVFGYLIRHRDRVVAKDELLEELWPGQLVTEFALTRCIAKARQAVHDDGVVQRGIKTLHRHGYRCVAAVESRGHSAAADAQPADRLPIHEVAAFPSPSPMDHVTASVSRSPLLAYRASRL
jgi:DNA-binding winged helix-turn-helix (wHTH) protein